MSLATGKRINCFIWKTLPVSDDVIDRVHQLALKEDQKFVADKFKFEWRVYGSEIGEGG